MEKSRIRLQEELKKQNLECFQNEEMVANLTAKIQQLEAWIKENQVKTLIATGDQRRCHQAFTK
jgi:uncharacterized protein YeaO (DUF488 family)